MTDLRDLRMGWWWLTQLSASMLLLFTWISQVSHSFDVPDREETRPADLHEDMLAKEGY